MTSEQQSEIPLSSNTGEEKKTQAFVDEIKIEGETVFFISPEMLMEE